MKKPVLAGLVCVGVLAIAAAVVFSRYAAQAEPPALEVSAGYEPTDGSDRASPRAGRISRPARKGPAAELAQRIAEASSTAAALPLVREALARGGLSTADLDTVGLAAHAPASSTHVSPAESFVLAAEAHRRATMATLTMRQLADMLHDFGFPYEGEGSPDLLLAEFFRTWVTEADRDPDDAHSFTPRFLAEMALRQMPAVDLTEDFAPEDVRFTLMELQLFAAAFDRLAAPPAPRAAAWSLLPVVHARSPCEDAKKWLGDQGDAGKWTAAAGEQLAGIAMGKGIEKMGGKDVDKAVKVLNVMMRFLKLVNLYRLGQVEVRIESDNPLHKFLPSEGRLLSAFVARAGVSEEDWEEYKRAVGNERIQRALKDCLGVAGLPTIADAGDFANDAADWTVSWRIVKGLHTHARMSEANTFYLPGNLEMKLQRDSPYSASARLIVDITPEPGAAHRGPELEDEVIVMASARTASPPSLGTLVNTIQGGAGDLVALIDALSEIATGWFQEMVQPKGFGVLTVRYHHGAAGRWSGTITSRMATRGMESSVSSSSTRFSSLESELVEVFQLGDTVEEWEETSYLRHYRIRATMNATYNYKSVENEFRQGGGCGESRSEGEMTLGGSTARQVELRLTHNLSSGEIHVSGGPVDDNNLMAKGRIRTWSRGHLPAACTTESHEIEGEPQDMGTGSVSFDAIEDPERPGVVKGRIREPGMNLRGPGFTQTNTLEYDLRRAD